MVLHSELTHSCDELIDELDAWVYKTEKVLRVEANGVPFFPANGKSAAAATATKLAAIRCVHMPKNAPTARGATQYKYGVSLRCRPAVGAPSRQRSSSRLWAGTSRVLNGT